MHLTWFDGVDVITFVYTYIHYIYNSESAIEIEYPIYSSFFFFFLSPLAMDRRIAFSLLSISMHLSIVEFYAHYWIYNYSDLSSLYEIIIKTLSNFLSSYVEFLTFFSMHLVGILIRINDFL